MATVIALSQVTSPALADSVVTFIVTVTNTGSSALTLSSLQVADQTKGANSTLQQPNYLTTNMPVGLGNPVIGASSSLSFPFSGVFSAPPTAGASPNQPGPLGVSGMFLGQPGSASYALVAQCQTSDGAVASTSLVVPVLSATAPFPRPEGGALQFSQGSNLINGLIMGVL
jgi:hypothetical protein